MARTDLAPMLRSGLAIAHRGNGRIQIGCDPDRGVVVDLPPAIRSEDFVGFLRFLGSPRRGAEIAVEAARIGLSDNDVASLMQCLRQADALCVRDADSGLRVRVHGKGPLAARMTTLLRDAGMAVAESTQRPRAARADGGEPLRGWTSDLVVLTDFLAHDPAILAGLMMRRIPHLPVRLRDGTGLVGPLVLPGLSSCLRCVDHHRADRDPGWPLVAGQIIGQTGHASAATMTATAALAMEQVEQIQAGLRALTEGTARTSPQTVDHTLEYLPQPARLRVRRWTPHPLCSCLFRR
ncbi:hypothetical protein [Williamsia sp.]|uniref:hypothetical protein n=1 Tax=Williamsia sp. TaxID=1872085 RepID=UPI001A194924|nr:hypothetical protein [Williamsia sp.]MBJ7289952.1 hypothetical protein [Williamsia sp.]